MGQNYLDTTKKSSENLESGFMAGSTPQQAELTLLQQLRNDMPMTETNVLRNYEPDLVSPANAVNAKPKSPHDATASTSRAATRRHVP